MKKNKISIFLDDERDPIDIKLLMGKFFRTEWVVVRNYQDFVNTVDENIGNIDLVTFDHDIACVIDGHEKTGKDCADYLIYKCIENDVKFPNWFVHTQNIIGKQNIISSIMTYLKNFEGLKFVLKYHSSGIIENNIV